MDDVSRPSGQTDVLVIDDSALVRQLMMSFLGAHAGFTVRTAADPLIAMRKIEARRPDVIVLDLQMPRMDGLTFLRRIMDEDPMPVVVCSSLVPDGSEAAMRALQLGAAEVVLKPRLVLGESLAKWQSMFIERVSAAAQANAGRLRLAQRQPPLRVPAAPLGCVRPIDRVVVMGASTGGTEALARVLCALPADAPAIAVVQHMPAPYTAAFAARLDASCAMRVREARENDLLEQGTVLIAPGSHHLSLVHDRPESIRVQLGDGPQVSRHRPSVDVLFSSAAQVVGAAAIGVLMTGMGADGALGLLQLRRTGAITIAQDEATSVVFGMPKAAIEAGAAAHVVPLDRIAELILSAAAHPKQLPGAMTRIL